MTDVSYNAKSHEILSGCCNLPYNHQDIARAIVTILSDTNALLRAKKAARESRRARLHGKRYLRRRS